MIGRVSSVGLELDWAEGSRVSTRRKCKVEEGPIPGDEGRRIEMEKRKKKIGCEEMPR